MTVSRYACVFARTPTERLGSVARLVRAIPAFLYGVDGELELHHCLATGYTAALATVDADVLGPGVLARLRFWSARAGARTFLREALPAEELTRFRAELERCDRSMGAVPLPGAEEAVVRFFRAIGVVSSGHPSGARMVLATDVDGPGAEGMRYTAATRLLFVPGVLAPPPGDQFLVSVRHTESSRLLEGWATVVEVRGRADAGPGRPAGFTVRLEESSPLHELLAERVGAARGAEARSTPRYAVKAPVRVVRAGTDGDPAPAAAAAPRPVVCATERELGKDWIENLSQGGAFVRTSAPHPVGTELALELTLPDGSHLGTSAVVAFASKTGMGLRFVLTPEQDELLAAAIARISARPRRALVVDDDALARRLLADALGALGFEVLTAPDASSGLHVLIDELLALDVFVTDLVMPGLGGEELIRMIRDAGGESELAIIAVTSRVLPSLAAALQAAGADAVLDKADGPERIAEAAAAVLGRRRSPRREDAA